MEVFPAYLDNEAIRVEFFGDEIDRISVFDPLTGSATTQLQSYTFNPAKQFVTPADKLRVAIKAIRAELDARVAEFESQGKLLEAQRIRMRTEYDIEMMQEMGFCQGIENYSRHLSGRAPGSTPGTLLDFFPDDFLYFADESHATIPQIGGMYEGDRLAQDGAGGARLPPPQCAGQPPVEVQRIHGQNKAGCVRERHTRAVRSG